MSLENELVEAAEMVVKYKKAMVVVAVISCLIGLAFGLAIGSFL